MTTRRLFLKSSGLAMLGFGVAPAWLGRAVYAAGRRGRNKVLVVIFQRGAMDGLNAVVPFGEERYYQLRPTLAIPRPDGTADSALDLDGFFGLHPALSPLKPIWDAGQLAIVHAAGSPDPTRSHFDAQDYMESGTPGRKSTRDGWLNRALAPRADASPVRAVSLGTTLARTLRGPNDAVAIDNLASFQVAGAGATFESMYSATLDRVLNGAGHETFEAVKLIESVQKQPYAPGNGAQYPSNRLGRSLQQVARLIQAEAGLEVAFADMGGWDTHVNQAASQPTQGQLANLLGQFAAALAAFYADLGDRMEDVAVVTMSEFGRTARENGSRGTDHGHANVMFAFGGAIRGGKVYGRWPGLAPEQLYEGRDLALTTDFRDVLGELVARQLGVADLEPVFPGHRPQFLGIANG